MKTRLISIACMLPLLIFLVIGKLPLAIAALVVSAIALYEFYRGFEKLEIKANISVAAALLLSLYGVIYTSLFIAKNWELYNALVGLWLFAVIGISLLLILIDKEHNILGPTYTMLGLLYIGYLTAHVCLIDARMHEMVWLPFVIAFMSDAGGFFGGLYFGKHRLSPALSPKKTVEGFIGAIIVGTISALIFALIACRDYILLCVVLGVIGSAIAEWGDLIASAFKRKMGIKDYSNLIPGHGGVLDRLDSAIFVVPLVYYAIVLFIE